MLITKDTVKYVAGLAQIAVTEDEAERLTKELDAIIDFVGELDKVDTEGLEPTYQVTGLTNVTREDATIDYGVTREELLKNSPNQQDNQIKVPKVL